MTEPRWLDSTQLQSWVAFVAVLERLPAALNSQLVRDEDLTHFDYFVLAMLSDAPQRTLRMTTLATATNATLPRLSRVVSRLEDQGFVRREPCAEDGRATNAVMTELGWQKIVRAAPGHVANVRELVIDALTPAQLTQLEDISRALLTRLEPPK